jgi:cobalt-zinc-cadmium efflux system membrane fusion protein
MSDQTEQEREEQVIARSVADAVTVAKTHTEETRTSPARRVNRRAVVAIVAIVVIAGAAVLLWRLWPSKAGRPVPPPRTVTLEQSNDNETNATGATAAEPTITLTPSQVQRAGLKVEPVGEQLATEAGNGQAATGIVQSNAYRETPVVSLVGGIVRNVGAELGQNIERGQSLVTIFSDELANTQSRYLAAQAELDEHHKHHQRTARLVEIGAASREEFEMATTKLKSDEAEVASLRQRLLLLGLTSQQVNGLRSSSQISSEVSLPSPVSGTITSRSVNPGEVIEANKELMRVTDLSSVWVVGQVYEKDLARVRIGSGASITSDAYPGRVFRGRVSYVDPRLDPVTRTAQVRTELANPGQALKIGMYVNVAFAIIGSSEATLPVIPVSAVQNINNQQIVFVATANPNVFIMRPVRLGPESNASLPVLEGLSIGDRLVTEGSFLLRAEWLKSHPAQ